MLLTYEQVRAPHTLDAVVLGVTGTTPALPRAGPCRRRRPDRWQPGGRQVSGCRAWRSRVTVAAAASTMASSAPCAGSCSSSRRTTAASRTPTWTGTVRRAARQAVARPAAETSPGWGMSWATPGPGRGVQGCCSRHQPPALAGNGGRRRRSRGRRAGPGRHRRLAAASPARLVLVRLSLRTRRTDPAPLFEPPCPARPPCRGGRTPVTPPRSRGQVRGRWVRRGCCGLGAGRAGAISTSGARCPGRGWSGG